MNIEQLEQIVGPINRGKLGVDFGFPPHHEPVPSDVPAYYNESQAQYRPPTSEEDLSHLNGKSTERMSRNGKAIWERMTPSERRRRSKMLSEAGKIGGKATRDIRHMHGV